jgi:hypothetical protein
MMHKKGSMKFSSIIMNLENHMIERLQLSKHISLKIIAKILKNDLDLKTMA